MQFKKFQDVLCAFEVILIFVMKFQIIFILQFCAAGLFEKSMTEFVRTGLFAFFLENRANGSFVYHNVTPFFSFPNPPLCCTLKRKHFGTAQQHMYILSETTEQKPQILMKPGFNAKWICYFGCQQKCRIVLVVSKTIYQQSCMTFVVSNTPLANLKTVCF